MSNPKLQKKFQGFIASNETELYSSEGLPAVFRKAWHELAQQNGLYSTSAGEGISRHVIVSKRPFQVNGKPLIISATAQRRFRDDFGLKLNLCDYEDFEYYVDLFGARPLLTITRNAINEFDGIELKWMTYLIEVKKRIWDHIKKSPGYNRFVNDDLSLFKKKLKFPSNYLVPSNDGKLYVSFDLKSANYASLFWYAPEIFVNESGQQTNSWSEFVCGFAKDHPATSEYLKLSKLFRQKIFWEFDHGRQAILWEYLILDLAEKIDPKMFLSGYHISDEIVFEIDESSIPYFQNLELDSSRYRINFFHLRKVAEGKSWIIRESLDGECDIKCCNPTEFTIIWKHVHNIALEKRDFKFRWNQKLCDWEYTDDKIKWLL